jgi:hypothetical protein
MSTNEFTDTFIGEEEGFPLLDHERRALEEECKRLSAQENVEIRVLRVMKWKPNLGVAHVGLGQGPDRKVLEVLVLGQPEDPDFQQVMENARRIPDVTVGPLRVLKQGREMSESERVSQMPL